MHGASFKVLPLSEGSYWTEKGKTTADCGLKGNNLNIWRNGSGVMFFFSRKIIFGVVEGQRLQLLL